MFLKVSDNYSASIIGNFSKTATVITVDVAPVKEEGFLTVYDLDGNQLEKIYYSGVDLLDLTGCVRGLSFDENSLTPVDGFAKDLKNSMGIKMSVSEHYLNPLIDALNGDLPTGGVMKNPASRVISDPRHLVDKEYADLISTTGIVAMLVSDAGGIKVNVNPGTYILNGVIKVYAGAANQSLTDNATNYIQILNGSLNVATDAFDDDAIPLAYAVTVAGDIISLVDTRPFYTGVDITPAMGLGRDANGMFVQLGTDPGLEFTGDGLEAKIKTGGGLVKDADGLSIGGVLPVADGSNLTGINNASSGSFTMSSTAQIDITLDFLPSIIKLSAIVAGAVYSLGGYTVDGGNKCMFSSLSNGVGLSASALYLGNESGGTRRMEAQITNVSATGFSVTSSLTGTTIYPTTQVYWEAIK